MKSYSAGIADIDIYNVILAGFSELLDANPILSPAFDNAETWDLVRAIATDLTDGKLDGVAIDGNIIFVDPDGTGQTSLPLPALDADDISNLVDAANAWAAVNFPGITIPPIDLSAFGNPTVLPPGGWSVTGSLEVTGVDALLLGEDNGPKNSVTFTPTAVDVATSGSAASGIDGFVFYVDDIFHSIGMTIDPVGIREVVSVSAFVPGNSWFTAGSSPIGGASMSLLGLTYVLRFIDVELINSAGGTTSVILNGSLDVRQSTD